MLDEIGERLGLQGKLAMTPAVTAIKGVPRETLAQIMNAFDVHLFMSHSEGFGLPIAESLACGVPTFVTDYSSMSELVSEGGGAGIKVHDYDTFVTWENELANADIGDAADKVNEIFEDKEHALKERQAAAENMYTPDWNEVALQFRQLLLKAAGQEVN